MRVRAGDRIEMLLLVAWLVAVPGPPAAAQESPETAEAAETVTIELPLGDPVAGRRAFRELSCTSCHRVAGDPGLPEPVSAHPGPTLGPVQSLQPPEQIAASILFPSRQIVEPLEAGREDGLSHMGDFSRAITVRQLTDLVAYLRSLSPGRD